MNDAQAAREDRRGQITYARMMLLGTLSVAKLLLTSAGDVKRMRQTKPTEKHYVRPPRRYELPAYSEGMQFCRSSEQYLRPTRLCNCRAPEVIALANQLGACQKSDLRFAQAAFEFAKEQMTLEIGPLVPVEENLRRGTGTCFELISVFIALCRAAGIKARYKLFATEMIQAWQSGMIDVDPLAKKWYDSLGYFLLEGEGEAFVDGQWMVAHVGPTAERQASAAIPITRFGEDSLGVWFTARPGTIMRLESLPVGLAAGSKILHRIAPGSMERINVSVLEQIEQGRQVLQKAGGLAAYDEQARSHAESAKPASPS
jgi:hypothetical protein